MNVRGLDWKLVVAVLLLALVLRVVSMERSVLIAADASRFLTSAERVEAGDFGGAIEDVYHPFTAFATGAVNTLQRALLAAPEDFRAQLAQRERAAHIVVLLAGLLLVWLQMHLAARLFPGAPALVVGLLAAAHPYFVRSSADIMSDTPCLAFMMLALYQGVVAIDEKRRRAVVMAGVATGLAYLARPEGLVVVPILSVYWLLRARREWGVAFGRIAAFAAVTLIVMLPYVVAISSLTGRPTLTLKKSTIQIIGISRQSRATPDTTRAPRSELATRTEGAPIGASKRAGSETLAASILPWPASAAEASRSPTRLSLYARSLRSIFARWYSTAPVYVALAFAVAIAVHARRRTWDEGHRYYAIAAGCMILVLARLLVSLEDPDYLVRRHVFFLVALTLPIAAEGLMALGRLLSREHARRISFALIALMVSGMAARALEVRRDDQIAQLAAADWIVERYGRGETIYSDREKIAYYAGAQWFQLQGDTEAVLASIQARERAWVAFYPQRLQYLPELAARVPAAGSGFRLMQTFEEPNRDAPTSLSLFLWERPAEPGDRD